MAHAPAPPAERRHAQVATGSTSQDQAPRVADPQPPPQADAESSHEHAAPSSRELTGLAFSATLHCLTGCVIGEVTGMAIGTALGWSNLATIALAVGLAYVFGFGLTSVPLARAGLAFGAIVPIALAADTVSITIMEAIDNAFVAIVPGAMDAGIGDPLLWGSVLGGFVVAFPFAWLANRYMIARGKGHAVVHAYHGH